MEILFDTSDSAVHKPKVQKNSSSRGSSILPPTNSGPEIPKSHEFIVNNAHKNVSIFSFDKGTHLFVQLITLIDHALYCLINSHRNDIG